MKQMILNGLLFLGSGLATAGLLEMIWKEPEIVTPSPSVSPNDPCLDAFFPNISSNTITCPHPKQRMIAHRDGYMLDIRCECPRDPQQLP